MKRFVTVIITTMILAVTILSAQAETIENVQTNNTTLNKEETTIRYEVKGQNVYVELIIPNFSFEKDEKSRNVPGEGHLRLFVNGTEVNAIHQAAFIIKGLPKGKHEIAIEVVHNDGTPYGVKEEFDVEIT